MYSINQRVSFETIRGAAVRAIVLSERLGYYTIRVTSRSSHYFGFVIEVTPNLLARSHRTTRHGTYMVA